MRILLPATLLGVLEVRWSGWAPQARVDVLRIETVDDRRPTRPPVGDRINCG
jgi:hypothetical protein